MDKTIENTSKKAVEGYNATRESLEEYNIMAYILMFSAIAVFVLVILYGGL